MRSGDIGDGAGRSARDAGPLDLDAVRADDDLIEALAAGLVPPPCGPRDPCDVEGELVALLAGWVADVRPETLLHPVPAAENAESENAESWSAENTADDSDEDAKRFIGVRSGLSGESQPLSLLEHNEVTQPVRLAPWRAVAAARPYLLRAAAALVTSALIGSGVIAQSYGAHPGEPLWAIAKLVFPAKSRSVEAASTVSTALNTARVALESGRIAEAREAFQTVAAQLGDVDPADGRVELDHQMDYLSAQLSGAPATMSMAEHAPPDAADQPLATGSAGAVIPSGPAVTPGATAALAAPSTSPAPAVLAAPAGVTSEGSPTPAVASSPPPPDAVLAAPSPSVVGSADLPPAPPASAPAVGSTAKSAPPATDPVGSAPATTNPPAQNLDPTTDPPQQSDTSGPVVDPGTNNPGTNDSAADNPGATSPANSDNESDSNNSATNNGDTNSGDNNNASANNNSDNNNADSNNKNTDSTQGNDGSHDSAAAQSPASDRSADAAAPLDASIDGVAGSTLGQVTGVVTDTSVS